MDRKMSREFVCVLTNVENPGSVVDALNLGGGEGCRVTEYKGTITIACQTIGGLGHIANICSADEGEKPINATMRKVSDEIVKFIG